MASENQKPDDDNYDTSSRASQDELPTANRGQVTQASVVTMKRKSRLMPWLIVIIVLLFMVLAGLFGWLWWRDRGSEPATPTGTNGEPVVEAPVEEEESACADDFTPYANSDLGVEFCYPTVWGIPTATDAKFAEADTGQRWLISFADNEAVHAGLVTADWTTAVGRDGTCVDPAVQTMPTVESVSTEWVIEAAEGDGTAVSALRGIQNNEGVLLINEYVDSLLSNGVCLNGYKAIDNELYPVVAASYYVGFNEAIASPQQHIDNPEALIPAEDRTDFATFVTSITALTEESSDE